MSEYTARVTWTRGEAKFSDNRYSRAHEWTFDGGLTVPASSSPHSVRVPFSDPAAVDPEEAFVASISSCHMLWFLWIAAKNGFVVESYRDDAKGIMEENGEGRVAITRVTLRPKIEFSKSHQVTAEEVRRMHDEAHHECFIANSVRSTITIE